MKSPIERSLLYSSFNARALNPVDVASTFIPPPEFFKLAANAHTCVVGPRGSGKTTLLKMLLQPAIEAWDHDDAERLRTSVNFTGVFVPTDVTLTSQLEAALEGLQGSDSLIRAAYSLHVLRAIVTAMEYRTGRIQIETKYPIRRVELTASQEREIVAEVSHGLKREPRTLSFRSLRADISSWLTDIFETAQKQRLLPAESQSLLLVESGLLRLGIVSTAQFAINAFESICSRPGEKWAFLCDELELAPPVIVSDLFRLVRSTDERLLFKLSLSPYTGGRSNIDAILNGRRNGLSPVNADVRLPPPEEREDFDTIRLWFPYKKEGFGFARQLAQSVIERKGYQNRHVEDLLGVSDFDTSEAESRLGQIYAPGSPHNERMRQLARVDPTFASYLRIKKIRLDAKVNDDDERARTLRKINSIVIVREAFKKEGGARSRKNPTLYTGSNAFLSICESNPRLLIGLMNQLLATIDASITVGKKLKSQKIPSAKQADVLKSAAARFRAYLRTIPISGSLPKARGLLTLVDKIGEYFHDEVVVRDFDDDPDTSFIVDSSTQPDIQNALQQALNAGAIIWVPDASDGSLLTSLSGKRFRLSYLLAPHYQLPLQLGRPISLKRILGEDQTTPQPLFEDLED